MKKRFPWFEILLIVVALSIQLYAALSDAYNLPNTWFARDDAYYYFKVAQNISEGRGSTFDGIHPTNGYHPLWTLVCIPIFALARFDLILPLRVLLIVMGTLNVATAIVLYRLLRGALSFPAGVLAAVYWTFDPFVQFRYYRPGLESGIALLFIVLLLYLLYRFERSWRVTTPSVGQIATLGIIAALAVLSRLDLIFFGVVIGAWIIFRETPMRYLLPLDVAAIFAAGMMAFIVRLGTPHYYDVASSSLIMIVLGVFVNTPLFYFFRLYQRPSHWRPARMLGNVLLSVTVSTLVLSVLLWIANAIHLLPAYSRAVLLLNGAFLAGFILLIRAAALGFRKQSVQEPAEPPLEFLRKRWGTWLKEGAIYYGIVGGTLSLYMLWSKLAFGTFSPVSGQIKYWWAQFLLSVYGRRTNAFLSLITLNPDNDFNAWEPATTLFKQWEQTLIDTYFAGILHMQWETRYLAFIGIFLIALGLVLLLRRGKTIRTTVQAGLVPLFAGSFLQSMWYIITGYASPENWYWLTQPLLICITTVLAVDTLLSLLLKRWTATRAVMWALVAIYGIRSATVSWNITRIQMPYGATPPDAPTLEVVPFLEALTKPGDIIGMTGGGNVGYFIHDRTIVNMDGLINSYEYLLALKDGSGADYLYNTGMRYVFANPDILESNPYRGQYTNRLQPIIDWGGKDLMRLLPKPAP
jgi:hypothetical protein